MVATAPAPESVKDAVIGAIRALPDDVTVEDILESLYVRQKIETGLRQCETGQTLTHDDATKRLGKWLNKGSPTEEPKT